MKIALIGAGNLATQLGYALVESHHSVVQLYSRTQQSAAEAAERLGCPFTTDIQAVTAEADLYILAVKDSVLPHVAKELVSGPRRHALFVHTAGSMPMELLHEAGAHRYGVFYPMQTFSKSRKTDFRTIPCFIEAGTPADSDLLEQLARDLGTVSYPLSSEHRRQLHLSAVFACNFVNHCYVMAERIVREAGLPFEILLPLIDETASKVHCLPPVSAQTGPAVRYDENVMAGQLKLLESFDETMADTYRILSKGIHQTALNTQKNDDTITT